MAKKKRVTVTVTVKGISNDSALEILEIQFFIDTV
jgi:hypothetical protein